MRIHQSILLKENTTIMLDPEAHHHLCRVLRAKKGDHLILFNGQGGEYQAIITKIDKKGTEVHVGQFLTKEVESPLSIHLAQGIARGEKMDFIIQKGVELGVTKFIPLITERSNVKLDKQREEKRLLHWRSVVISACEQSGRNQVPEVCPPIPFKKWVTENRTIWRFILTPHVKSSLPAVDFSKNNSIEIMIGPEGGFSPEELELAKMYHFFPLQLGPRILRTETASIAAVVALQCQYGDMLKNKDK